MTEVKNRLTASLAVDDQGNKVIWISFPYDLHLLFKIRELPGRKYHPEFKCWSTPVLSDIVIQLKEWGFFIDEHLTKYLERKQIVEHPISTKGIPGLKGKLYPFQKKGVIFIEQKKGRALIADEMGLGKTIQALAWLQLHPEKRPAIIVCPAVVKLGWVNEALTWMNKPKIEILMGKTPWPTHGGIIIVNYDIISAMIEINKKKRYPWVEMLKKRKPQVLITDECHYYKSNSANRTKAIKSLAKGIPHVIALSGTPILNRPIEIYNAIKMIDPTLFPDWNQYTKRYCNRKNTGFGWDVSGHSNTDELHRMLKESIMIRRLKVDVLPDLPSKVLSLVPVQITNEDTYRAAEADFIAFVQATKGKEAARRASNAKAFAEIEGLKQLCMNGKLEQSIAWIKNFLEVTEEKLVVFAVHRFVIDALMNEFKNIAVKIDGSVSMTDRQKSVEDFQKNDNIRLFIGNIKAAGVGITLTAASKVVFLELPWTPGELVQAEDRVHRIGQKESVTIYYLLASDTIEEKIARLLDSKKQVLDSVLDGKDSDQETLFKELMKMYE
jgi:SWI/SNF-related matrix-associated actin-dependent regulator 1 of chromatin subfamily A